MAIKTVKDNFRLEIIVNIAGRHIKDNGNRCEVECNEAIKIYHSAIT